MKEIILVCSLMKNNDNNFNTVDHIEKNDHPAHTDIIEMEYYGVFLMCE